jgi:hypothetical protein
VTRAIAVMTMFEGWVIEMTEHPDASFFVRRNAACISLPRHETALFGGERWGLRE